MSLFARGMAASYRAGEKRVQEILAKNRQDAAAKKLSATSLTDSSGEGSPASCDAATDKGTVLGSSLTLNLP